MKICENCGAYNSDERTFCIDCDEKLGDEISEREEKQVAEQISASTEKLYNRDNPLYVSIFDKIVGIGCIISFIALIVLAIFFMGTDNLELVICGAVFGVLGAVDALIPSITWELEKIRLSFTVAEDDLSPSGYYMFFRRLAELICLFVAVMAIVGVIYNTVNT